MSLGLWFWLLMFFWLVFGVYTNRAALGAPGIKVWGGDLFIFILFGLIGWKVFGPPIT